MRTSKDIDFVKVDFITYAVDEYLNDIPMYDLVVSYINLYPLSDNAYQGTFNEQKVVVNTKTNTCYIDGEKIDGEQFVILFEGEDVDPCPIIKKITGVDLDDYISDVTYSDGTTEYLDVKGKKFIIYSNRKPNINYC